LPLFTPSAHLQVLPSFPTRRSSDLGFAVFQFGTFLMASKHLASTNGVFSWHIARIQPRLASIRMPAFTVSFRAGRHRKKTPFVEDRKSTRLNSSHVSISYAVFCLKK